MRQPLSPSESGREPTRAHAELRIPAGPEWVGVARLAAAGIASRLDLSIEDLEDLKLAVAEACNCCIQNGGGRDVHISADLGPKDIEITVERAGAGSASVRPASPPDETELGGLGVFIIRALMDEVTYVFDTAGTRLKLTKRVEG